MEKKIPIVAITGPTATGKTALSIAVARHFGGEIISCDSMQLYRGLPIGTAQPTPDETAQVPHHLVNFLDVTQDFSVSDYVTAAGEKAQEIYAKNKLPVLVGGTGLYARSLLRGFSFEETARDDALRAQLAQQAEELGIQPLYDELKKLDPISAENIHPNNVKRVLRALEYCRLTGEPFSAQAERSQAVQSPYNYLMLCIAYRDRQKLYDRIDLRVDKMLAAGLLDEAKAFYKICKVLATPPTAAQAIGYKELFPYFEGEISLDEATENIKRESRRYAKRQLTWFRREQDAVFIYADDYTSQNQLEEKAIQLAENFLNESGALPVEQ